MLSKSQSTKPGSQETPGVRGHGARGRNHFHKDPWVSVQSQGMVKGVGTGKVLHITGKQLSSADPYFHTGFSLAAKDRKEEG